MESESYSQLLGYLADALENWADELFSRHSNFTIGFSSTVEHALVPVMAKLGARAAWLFRRSLSMTT